MAPATRTSRLRHTTAPISAGLLVDLPAYTAALDAYRAGDARSIAEAFIRAALFAATTGRRLVEDLQAELAHSQSALSRLRPQATAHRVLPLLIAQPVVNAAYLQEHLGIPAVTAHRALTALTEAGVLVTTTGQRRNRLWHHPGILRVLDGYAHHQRRPVDRAALCRRC